MSLLETPEAQALLDDTVVEAEAVRACRRRLTAFLQRYLPLFYRKEQAHNAGIVIAGLLSDLERKTCEPIARREGVERKPIQFFVGGGKWDDEAVMAELRTHVVEEFADPHGILVLDGSGFPKKGHASCGVKRQWCGRLGKVENCQVGVFLCYATAQACAIMDRRLFLPEEWATDAARREQTYVPPDVPFRTKLQIAEEMLAAHGAALPHQWITGDDDFGRSAPFRAGLRARGEHYVLDVPCDTLIRDLERRRPPRLRRKGGRKRETPFCRADAWAQRQAPTRWERLHVSDGEKGPHDVLAMCVRVRARHDQRVGDEERLVVIRTVEAEPRTTYALSNASPEVPLAALVRVVCQRHRIEETFEAAKGEVGLHQYEVRSWTGWHHHFTLCLVALLFLTLERRRLGEKIARGDSATDAPPLLAAAS